MGSASVEEHIVFFTGLDGHLLAVGEPPSEFLDGTAGDGYKPLLGSFAQYAYEVFVEIEVGELQVGQLRDAKATGEKHFDNGTVAVSFPFGTVDGCLQHIHFCGAEHFRQVFGLFGRLQKLRRIVAHVSVEDQKTIKRAHTAKDAGLRTGTDADVGQRSREVFQVGQHHVCGFLAFRMQIVHQLVKVIHVGIERIGGITALQFQVAVVLLCQICCTFLCHVLPFSYICRQK